MQCSCGGETTYHVHEIKTLDKAKEWFTEVEEKDLPIKIRRDVCKVCGRTYKWPLTGGKYE